MNIGELRQRQSLSLESKILKAIRVIEDYYDMYDGDVYISTGGVDSTVLRWLAEQSTKDIPCVCVGACEPSGNLKLNHDRGDIILKPPTVMRNGKKILATKKWVIQEYGYPLITKKVAMTLSRYLRTKSKEQKKKRLYGYLGRNGKTVTFGIIPKKYQPFIYAPFEFSEKCCDFTKKKPLKQYEKQTGRHPITGEMACESVNRRTEYLKHGCIMHDKKRSKCTPLGPWLPEDVAKCVKQHNIKISNEYGEVVGEEGNYKYSGEQRTGCEICGFGLLYDTTRFERLKKNKPGIYKEMMQGGKWIRKPLYRWVKFRPTSIPIWSNLYWIPDEEGYGYKFVLDYLYRVLELSSNKAGELK